MHRYVEKPNYTGDDECLTHSNPYEVLHAAIGDEGLPVEWLYDRMKTRVEYAQ